MFAYKCYKALKQRLTSIAPCYIYTGQYQASKTNLNYIVPAIYIETPRSTGVQFYGKRILTTKTAQYRIHYVSLAPFKEFTNGVQDDALEAHSLTLEMIDSMIAGKELRCNEGQLLTQRFIPVNVEENNFLNGNVYSIITYSTEVITRHLQQHT